MSNVVQLSSNNSEGLLLKAVRLKKEAQSAEATAIQSWREMGRVLLDLREMFPANTAFHNAVFVDCEDFEDLSPRQVNAIMWLGGLNDDRIFRLTEAHPGVSNPETLQKYARALWSDTSNQAEPVMPSGDFSPNEPASPTEEENTVIPTPEPEIPADEPSENVENDIMTHKEIAETFKGMDDAQVFKQYYKNHDNGFKSNVLSKLNDTCRKMLAKLIRTGRFGASNPINGARFHAGVLVYELTNSVSRIPEHIGSKQSSKKRILEDIELYKKGAHELGEKAGIPAEFKAWWHKNGPGVLPVSNAAATTTPEQPEFVERPFDPEVDTQQVSTDMGAGSGPVMTAFARPDVLEADPQWRPLNMSEIKVCGVTLWPHRSPNPPYTYMQLWAALGLWRDWYTAMRMAEPDKTPRQLADQLRRETRYSYGVSRGFGAAWEAISFTVYNYDGAEFTFVAPVEHHFPNG